MSYGLNKYILLSMVISGRAQCDGDQIYRDQENLSMI